MNEFPGPLTGNIRRACVANTTAAIMTFVCGIQLDGQTGKTIGNKC